MDTLECPLNSTCFPIYVSQSIDGTLHLNDPSQNFQSFQDTPLFLVLVGIGAILAILIIRPFIHRLFCQKTANALPVAESAHVSEKDIEDPTEPRALVVSPKGWFGYKLYSSKSIEGVAVTNKVKLYSGKSYQTDQQHDSVVKKESSVEKEVKPFREVDILRQALNSTECKTAAYQFLSAHSNDSQELHLLHKTKKTIGKSMLFFMDDNLLTLTWGTASKDGKKGGSRTMHFVDILDVSTWTNTLPTDYVSRYGHLLKKPFHGLLIHYIHMKKREMRKEVFLQCKTAERQHQIYCSLRKLYVEAMDRLKNVVILDDDDHDTTDEGPDQVNETIEQVTEIVAGYVMDEATKDAIVAYVLEQILEQIIGDVMDLVVDVLRLPPLEIPPDPLLRNEEESISTQVQDEESPKRSPPRSPRARAQSAKRWLHSKRASQFLARLSPTSKDETLSPYVAMQVKLFTGEYTPGVEPMAKAAIEMNKKIFIEEKAKKRGSDIEADVQGIGLSMTEKERAAHQILVANLLDGYGMLLLHKSTVTLGKTTRFFVDDNLFTLTWGFAMKPIFLARNGTHTMHFVDIVEILPYTNNVPTEYVAKYKIDSFCGLMIRYTHATKRNKTIDILFHCKDAQDQMQLSASFKRFQQSAIRRKSSYGQTTRSQVDHD